MLLIYGSCFINLTLGGGLIKLSTVYCINEIYKDVFPPISCSPKTNYAPPAQYHTAKLVTMEHFAAACFKTYRNLYLNLGRRKLKINVNQSHEETRLNVFYANTVVGHEKSLLIRLRMRRQTSTY